jgi:hypothetical protein
MPLKLHAMLGKAKANKEATKEVSKEAIAPLVSSDKEYVRIWRQESTLYEENKPTINRQETGNKPTINRQESDKELTINRQESDKQKSPVSAYRQESDKEVASKPTSEKARKRQETDYKPNIEYVYSSLVGLEKTLTEFIYKECQIARSKVTKALSLEYIEKAINKTKGSIKNTLQHIEKKGVIKRFKFKNGRGGWTQYELPDDIYNEIFQFEIGNKPTINWQETDNKVTSKPTSKPAIEVSSSSSLNINKTTTELSAEWEFDLTPYAKFKFTKTHLKQIAGVGSVSAEEVRKSLEHFSYDFDYDKEAIKKIRDPIRLLMKCWREGNMYRSSTYIDPEEAVEQEMAERTENYRRQQQENKLKIWEAGLNETERKKMLKEMPSHLTTAYDAYGIKHEQTKNWLIEYYMSKCSM